jgi:hypothetical protein
MEGGGRRGVHARHWGEDEGARGEGPGLAPSATLPLAALSITVWCTAAGRRYGSEPGRAGPACWGSESSGYCRVEPQPLKGLTRTCRPTDKPCSHRDAGPWHSRGPLSSHYTGRHGYGRRPLDAIGACKRRHGVIHAGPLRARVAWHTGWQVGLATRLPLQPDNVPRMATEAEKVTPRQKHSALACDAVYMGKNMWKWRDFPGWDVGIHALKYMHIWKRSRCFLQRHDKARI